jgi:hypothetical protein
MLPRHERRRLEEIESRLRVEDPEFVRTLTEAGGNRFSLKGISLRTALGLVSALLAVICVFVGEGGAFLMAATLAAVLILTRKWHVLA